MRKEAMAVIGMIIAVWVLIPGSPDKVIEPVPSKADAIKILTPEEREHRNRMDELRVRQEARMAERSREQTAKAVASPTDGQIREVVDSEIMRFCRSTTNLDDFGCRLKSTERAGLQARAGSREIVTKCVRNGGLPLAECALVLRDRLEGRL